MLSVLLELPLEPMAARMALTAAVVIGVAIAVGRLGPLVGGTLAGLPVVLGPGFLFLAAELPTDLTARAALTALLSLCATQVFLLIYVTFAARHRPWTCLAMAVGGWVVAAGLFQVLPPHAVVGVPLFGIVTLAAHRLGAPYARASAMPTRQSCLASLLLRGILAGILVATATGLAARLGPSAAGLLLVFPIGYVVLSITVHERFGAGAAATALHAAVLGTMSLATFCATLALVLAHAPASWAFPCALIASLVTTALLAWHRWWAAGPRDATGHP